MRGANEVGENWISILTRTGCFKDGDNDPEYPAKKVVFDVTEAIHWIFQIENINSVDLY